MNVNYSYLITFYIEKWFSLFGITNVKCKLCLFIDFYVEKCFVSIGIMNVNLNFRNDNEITYFIFLLQILYRNDKL